MSKTFEITESYLQIDYYEVNAKSEKDALKQVDNGTAKPYKTDTDNHETECEEI